MRVERWDDVFTCDIFTYRSQKKLSPAVFVPRFNHREVLSGCFASLTSRGCTCTFGVLEGGETDDRRQEKEISTSAA